MADRLAKARRLTGLTQAEFAAEIAVARSTVVNYERDEYDHERREIILRAWARRSGVPLDWIRFRGEVPGQLALAAA